MSVVRVGLGTLIFWEGHVLLHKRGPMSHCGGHWASPGGHLEMFETWEDCAKREILEECGPELEYANLRYLHTVDTPYPDEGRHYITIFMQADYVRGVPRVMEPDKCIEWRWFDWRSLPEPLMLGNRRMMEAFPHGYRL